MSVKVCATRRLRRADGVAQPLRVAFLERDTGFQLVVGKRVERLQWEHTVLASPISVEALAPMRLDALVVDLAILGPRCWEWLEELCDMRQSLAIVICTGSSTVAQRVRALRLGADDWLSKPCHPEELIARVEVVVRNRRRHQPRNDVPVKVGELEIHRDLYQGFVGGLSLSLTPREFQLIELLVSTAGTVLEREVIYERLWGYAMVRGDRSVDVFVHKLRRKLEKASPGWRYIHTHFGIGYGFAPEDVSHTQAQPVELELSATPELEPEPLPLAA